MVQLLFLLPPLNAQSFFQGFGHLTADLDKGVLSDGGIVILPQVDDWHGLTSLVQRGTSTRLSPSVM
ncbi:hypothetical protein D1646_07840 [Pseudoflavonifractor sp. 60]|nr:hypothetical protein [Pseudoflavonifractor sp. 60]